MSLFDKLALAFAMGFILGGIYQRIRSQRGGWPPWE